MKICKSFVEFTETFSSNEVCLQYLCDLKWSNGYRCIRCCHPDYIKGRAWYYRRCKKCGYDESCTAHTLFHKIKFPLRKAFWITFQIGTMKKGMSTMEISRQYNIHQETAWFFKRKVQEAMKHLQGTIFSRPIHTVKVHDLRSASTHNFTRLARECRINSQQNQANARLSGQALLISNSWPFNTNRCSANTDLLGSKHGCLTSQLPIHLVNLKNWLMGIHHRVSPWHLSFYFDEYIYRFERRKGINSTLPKLHEAMILLPWMPYLRLKCESTR